MLDTPWDPYVSHRQQPRYQPIIDCTQWPVLGSLNNCNIIRFTNKTTLLEEFEEIHKVVLYGIIENMISLFYIGKYVAINALDPTTMGYCVVNYVFESFVLQ